MIDGVEVVRHGKVRRAKLYYLRGLSARASRIKEKRFEKLGEEIKPAEPTPEEASCCLARKHYRQPQLPQLSAAAAAEAPKARHQAEAPKLQSQTEGG